MCTPCHTVPYLTALACQAVTLPVFELLRGFAAASHSRLILGEWTLARLGGGTALNVAAARYYYEQTSGGNFLGRCVWNYDGPGAWCVAARLGI